MAESLSLAVDHALEDAWRQRLLNRPPDPEPDLRFPPETLRPSAVLMPLLRRRDGYHVLFTVRARHLPVHPGQISFPGGRQDPADPGLWETALRETHEEIGLPPDRVEPFAALDPVISISRFHVTPYVGFVPSDFPFSACPSEVDELLIVPLAHLRDPAIHRTVWHVGPDGGRYPVHHFAYGDYDVWGMTGRIVHRFLTLTAGLV